MNIAAADAAGSYLNQDITGSTFWNRDIIDCQLSILG
jgi:hypothetical protein